LRLMKVAPRRIDLTSKGQEPGDLREVAPGGN
jgi:hypothetical protein